MEVTPQSSESLQQELPRSSSQSPQPAPAGLSFAVGLFGALEHADVYRKLNRTFKFLLPRRSNKGRPLFRPAPRPARHVDADLAQTRRLTDNRDPRFRLLWKPAEAAWAAEGRCHQDGWTESGFNLESLTGRQKRTGHDHHGTPGKPDSRCASTKRNIVSLGLLTSLTLAAMDPFTKVLPL